jgi:hypothetical protein
LKQHIKIPAKTVDNVPIPKIPSKSIRSFRYFTIIKFDSEVKQAPNITIAYTYAPYFGPNVLAAGVGKTAKVAAKQKKVVRTQIKYTTGMVLT